MPEKIPQLKKKPIDWSKVDPDSLVAALNWDKLARPDSDLAASKEKGSAFTVLKQADGHYRWISYSSNAYRDHDGEYVSTKALDEDVDRSDQSRDYGPLRWWHVGEWEADNPADWTTYKAGIGMDLGSCDFRMLKGRILVESGTFIDDRIGERIAREAPDLQLSLGFSHPREEPDREGAFYHIKTYERSLLPKGAASNRFTKLVVTEDSTMASLKEKTLALVALLKDEDLVAKVLQDADTIQKEADTQGVSFKEQADLTEKGATSSAAGGMAAMLAKKFGKDMTACKGCPELKDKSPEDREKLCKEAAGMAPDESEPEEEPTEEKEAPAAPAAVEEPAAVEAPAAGEPDAEDLPEIAVGDLTLDEFADLVQEVVSDTVSKESAALQTTQKEHDSSLVSLKEIVEAQARRIEDLENSLKELQGAQPRSVKALQGARASQSEKNVVKEVADGRKPGPDSAFMSFVVGNNQ